MKAVGLGAAGLGATGAAAPVFHDLDEVANYKIKPKHPWFVKERDYLDSTTEIDWSMMERYAGASWDNQSKHVTAEHNLEIRTTTSEKLLQRTLNKKPGDQLRDRAMRHGHRPLGYSYFTGRSI
ncbi:unnamed protein product, partial [marine sediment metagenome]